MILVHKGQIVLAIPKRTEEEAEQLCDALMDCVVPENGVTIGYSSDKKHLLEILNSNGLIQEERNPLVT